MIKKLFLIILPIMLLLGCKSNYSDDWYKGSPANFEGKELFYSEIPVEEEKKYLELLHDRSFCVVEKAEYERMTGQFILKKYVIAIRAVNNGFGGYYTVIQNDNTAIAVSYYILGGGVEVIKDVLLIQVDRLPKDVYVTCVSSL